MAQPYTIKQLAYHVKTMKESGESTALLIGAGVSVTAGIPLAGKMVEELIAKYPGYDLKEHENKPNAYNEVMKALTHNQRESFLREKIQNAKINLAHFFIGSLVSNGYVDCILTTNFDPLLVKTLALFNIYPSIYDLANTKKFLPSSIAYPNIFYLHGQGTAFRMLNTEDETKESTEYFTRLFDHLDKKHSWIVAGYSGQTDFIFKGLAEQPIYNNNLCWVGRTNEPPKHVEGDLCCKDSVRYINYAGADSFFRDLNNELGLKLPEFVEKPFSHFKKTLENIGELKFEQDRQIINADFLKQTYSKIDNAITTIEAEDKKPLTIKEIKEIKKGDLEQKISELYTLGKYKEIIKKKDEIISSKNKDAIHNLAWSYALEGEKYINKGDIIKGNKSFSEAISIKHDFHEAWYNWGTVLSNLARLKDNNEKLFEEAFKKYDNAIKIKPNFYEAWSNWAIYLCDYAILKGFDEKLFAKAFEMYEQAIKINPLSFESWFNYATDLSKFAEHRGNDQKLHKQAFEKYARALEIKPNEEEVWYNWGTNLTKLAMANGNDEELHLNAFEKYRKAIEIKKDYHEAFYNWGYALGVLAEFKMNDEKLYQQAFEKYADAVRILPDKYNAWDNWGNSLLKLAIAKKNDTELLKQAIEKFEIANKCKPHYSSYNLSCAYSLLNIKDKALEFLEDCLSKKATKMTRKHIAADTDLNNIKDLPRFQELLDKYIPVETQ
ncbi:MAG: SIR2 family protein [Bacteroidia bacterium]